MAFEKKKHDMLKWMLGRFRGVKMVFRKAEVEDSMIQKKWIRSPAPEEKTKT